MLVNFFQKKSSSVDCLLDAVLLKKIRIKLTQILPLWYSVSVIQFVTYIQQWRVSDVLLIDMCKVAGLHTFGLKAVSTLLGQRSGTYMNFSLKIKMAFCKGKSKAINL